MDLTPTQQTWLLHVDASEAFDGTVADYAREHELDIGKLYFYRSAIQAKRSKPQASAAFAAATRSMPASFNEAGVHIQLPNGVRLRLADLSESDLLSRLAAL